jgi:putative ABC transport system substrate-binding protein
LATDARHHDAFLQGLHALGYVEGQTIVLEGRWAEGHLQRLPDHAAELVRLQVDVIVAGNVPSARAASQATQRIPIVVAGGDAVGTGLIANLARPGGNITGLATNSAELSGKWLELLKEAVPARSRVAVLSHPDTPITALAVQELQVAAPPLGVQLQSLSVRDPGELEGAFAAMSREQAEALVVPPGSIFICTAPASTSWQRGAASRRSGNGERRWPRAACWPMDRTSPACGGVPPRMWTRSSKARRRVICRWSGR